MRVGFTGAQGTGKTTLLNAVEESDLGFTIVPSTARAALAAGYKVNRDADTESQLVTTVSRVALEDNLYRRHHKTIGDRTPLDSLAYTAYQAMNVWNVSGAEIAFYWEISERLVFEHMHKYDRIFYFPVYWPPKADGVRDTDREYQVAIDTLIQLFLKKSGVEYITMPKGSTKERLSLLTKAVN